MSLNLPQARRFARRPLAPKMPRLNFAQAPLINGLGKRYTGRFFQPQLESIDAPAAGSAAAHIAVQNDGFAFCTGHPQGPGYEGDWMAELLVNGSTGGTSTGFLWVATEAWIAAAKAAGASMYSVATAAGGGHYIGNGSAYGEANGTAAAFANSALVATGKVVGFVVNQSARKLRLYYDGAHVGTFTLAAPGPYRPCIGGWSGAVEGDWLAAPSSFASSYLVPT